MRFSQADNNIVRIAKGLDEKHEDKRVILVSKDAIVRIKATVVGVESQDYDTQAVTDEDLEYTGRCNIEVGYDEITAYYKNPVLKLSDEKIKEYGLKENEYVMLSCGTSTALGRYTKGKVVGLVHSKDTPCDITLLNSGQKFAAEALLMPAEEAPLVILKGPAGTAKTFLTLACGLEQVMRKKPEYRKVLPTRANVALGYLRGRSITNQYVLIDEAQNTSTQQMLGILTRAGEGTKIVLCGDLDQIDNTKLSKHSNGLAFALKTMAGSEYCHVVGFSEKETTRSPLAKEAAKRMVLK